MRIQCAPGALSPPPPPPCGNGTTYLTADYMFQAAIASIQGPVQLFAILFVCSLQFDTILTC